LEMKVALGFRAVPVDPREAFHYRFIERNGDQGLGDHQRIVDRRRKAREGKVGVPRFDVGWTIELSHLAAYVEAPVTPLSNYTYSL